ncbi:hypothetical protein [Actinomadura sp. NPDC048394]|uniref:hypothetical protein n=1 Tax=Actinomadura sp. NPDC048394 TaxID=3158223 RepID=UPI0033C11C52
MSALTEQVEDLPAFGYGRWRQPLRTRRDRDAETIREVLRNAGRPEFGHPGDGFFVDGGRDGEPFLVACASRARRRTLSPAAEIAAYTTALTTAGMRVEPPTGPDLSPLLLHVYPRQENERAGRTGYRNTDEKTASGALTTPATHLGRQSTAHRPDA